MNMSATSKMGVVKSGNGLGGVSMGNVMLSRSTDRNLDNLGLDDDDEEDDDLDEEDEDDDDLFPGENLNFK